MNTAALITLLCASGASPRPPLTPRAPLPPLDVSDEWGPVPTGPPAELIPPSKPDPLFVRADFCGVTLDANRWGGNPPMLVGADSTPSSTPPTMLLTPMLALYPRKWQDACLTEHAERGYTHFVWDPHPWNLEQNGMTFSIQQAKDWAAYLKSWGFYSLAWRGDYTLGLDAMLQSLFEANLIDFYIHGEEVDGKWPSSQFEASLQTIDAYVGGRVPIGVHFTADGGRHMCYPIGAPRDDFLRDWSPYDGRVHLMLQQDQSASAGLQCAGLGYARRHVNLGQGDGALGPGAPNSRVYAFETMASGQFAANGWTPPSRSDARTSTGTCTEDYGNLRNLELMWYPRDDPREPAMGGYGNGARLPNGGVL